MRGTRALAEHGLVPGQASPHAATTWGLVKGLLAGICAAVLFAGGAVVSRHLVGSGHAPVDLTLVRYLGCFPVALLALIVMPQRFRLGIAWHRLLALLALAGPPYHVLLLAGYGQATSGAGALLVTGLVPVLGLAVAWLAAREQPQWQAMLGALLVVGGLAVFGGLGRSASVTPMGFAIFVAAALAWAVLNHLVRVWSIDPLRLTIALAAWAPLFLPFWLLTSPTGLAALEPSADLALQLAYHGLLVAFGATALFFAAIRLAGTQRTASLLALVPPIAALLGAIFLGETLTGPEGLGAAIAVFGIALASVYAAPAK